MFDSLVVDIFGMSEIASAVLSFPSGRSTLDKSVEMADGALVQQLPTAIVGAQS